MVSPAVGIILRAPNYARRYGVVEHWALNEASGSALASINSANDMTAVNAPTSNPGKVYPLARQYTSASSQYHSLADNAALSGADIDMAGFAWCWLDTKTAIYELFSKYDVTGNQREWTAFYDNSIDRFGLAVSGDGTGSVTQATANTFGAVSTGAWHLLVWFHDSVNNLFGISIDGGAYDTAAHSAGIFNSTASFVVGSISTGALPWNGRIGPVGICKSPPLGIAALKNEIRDRLYANGAGRPYPWR